MEAATRLIVRPQNTMGWAWRLTSALAARCRAILPSAPLPTIQVPPSAFPHYDRMPQRLAIPHHIVQGVLTPRIPPSVLLRRYPHVRAGGGRPG